MKVIIRLITMKNPNRKHDPIIPVNPIMSTSVIPNTKVNINGKHIIAKNPNVTPKKLNSSKPNIFLSSPLKKKLIENCYSM